MRTSVEASGFYCTFLPLTASTDFSTRVTSPSPLQIMQGMPAAPQPQALGPFHGLFGWSSQTHPVSSQFSHLIG